MIFKLLKNNSEITTIESDSLEEAIATCELLESNLDDFSITQDDTVVHVFNNKKAFKNAKEQFMELGAKVREHDKTEEGTLSERVFLTKLIFTDNVEAVETDTYVLYKHNGNIINPVLFEIQPLRDIQIKRFRRLENSNRLFDIKEGYQTEGVIEEVKVGTKVVLNYKEFAFLITGHACAGHMSTVTHKPVGLNISFHGGEPVVTIRSREKIPTGVIYLDANNKKLGLTDVAKVGLPDIEQTITKIAQKQETKSVADLAAGLRALIQTGTYEVDETTIKLPCKLGTPVWQVSELACLGDLNQACLGCYSSDFTGSCYTPGRIAREVLFSLNMLEDFGKTVFLTETEAKRKIEELKAAGEVEEAIQKYYNH